MSHVRRISDGSVDVDDARGGSGGRIGRGAGDTSERLLTAREVGEWLGLSTETVLRRFRAGELPGFRLATNVLRFRESEIGAWLEGRRGGAPPAPVLTVPYPAVSTEGANFVPGGRRTATTTGVETQTQGGNDAR